MYWTFFNADKETIKRLNTFISVIVIFCLRRFVGRVGSEFRFYDILLHDRMIMLRFSAWLVFSCAQVFLSFQEYALLCFSNLENVAPSSFGLH